MFVLVRFNALSSLAVDFNPQLEKGNCMTNWIIIIGMGVITYAIRLSPILLLERIKLSDNSQQALRFVPVAVLTAIIIPEMFYAGGQLDISLGNERLIAGAFAFVVAWWTQNILWTVGLGMFTLWGLQWIK